MNTLERWQACMRDKASAAADKELLKIQGKQPYRFRLLVAAARVVLYALTAATAGFIAYLVLTLLGFEEMALPLSLYTTSASLVIAWLWPDKH